MNQVEKDCLVKWELHLFYAKRQPVMLKHERNFLLLKNSVFQTRIQHYELETIEYHREIDRVDFA